MSENPLVYISVLNWNQRDQTVQCLESLAALDYDNYRIVVVDNASSDDSVAVLRGRYPDLTLIECDQNTGYAGGHQRVVDLALHDHADLIWILNNDLVTQPDTLTQLVDAYRQRGNALYGSVPLAADSDAALRDTVTLFPRKYMRLPFRQALFVLHPYGTYGELFPDPAARAVAGLSGSSLLIPTEVIREHGFMDVEFFLYGEEVDYCFRLRVQGVASILVPGSIVFHRASQSSAANARLTGIATYYRTRNQLFFIQRHNGAFFVIQAVVRNLVWAAMRCVTGGHTGRSRAVYMLRGTWDGLRNRWGKTLAPEDAL